ncbi:DUF7134 domain-containing protein [Saccharopolyspora sp. NPDC000995]
MRISLPDHRLVLDGALALLVFALAGGTSLVAVRGAGPLLWYGILGVSVGLTACLVFRRVRPTAAVVAGSACMLVLVALPNMTGGVSPVLPFSLVYPVLLYSVVACAEWSAFAGPVRPARRGDRRAAALRTASWNSRAGRRPVERGPGGRL